MVAALYHIYIEIVITKKSPTLGRAKPQEGRSSSYKSNISKMIHAMIEPMSRTSMVVSSRFGKPFVFAWSRRTRSKAGANHSAAIRFRRVRTICRALFDALTAQAIQGVCCRQSYAFLIKFRLWLVAFVLALGHSMRAIQASHI